jgi:hypothetical protein
MNFKMTRAFMDLAGRCGLRMLPIILGALSILCAGGAAQADTVYQYTGNAYQSGGPYHISITIDVDATASELANLTQYGPIFLGDLSPYDVAFSISDGVTTLSNLALDSPYFDVETDSAGNIVLWDVHAQDPAGDISFLSINAPGPGSSGLVEDISTAGSNMNDPGTWTKTTSAPSAAPEPSSGWLLAIGALICGGLAMGGRVFSRQ